MSMLRTIRLMLMPLLGALLLANGSAASEGALRYTLDASASNVSAKVPFFGLSSKTARFPKMAGMVLIVPGAPERAVIDVTFDATALEASDQSTAERLRGEKFFWVEKYPTVRFVGRSLELKSATEGIVRGDLTARGVTKPQTLRVTFEQDPLTAPRGAAIKFTGKTTIDRRDYGMKSFQLVVGNQVDITLKARMVPN